MSFLDLSSVIDLSIKSLRGKLRISAFLWEFDIPGSESGRIRSLGSQNKNGVRVLKDVLIGQSHLRLNKLHEIAQGVLEHVWQYASD